ncbi:replication protein [Carnobacterium maltaromaticum]|uniref:replication protein n=1 Tax=Carnobacterium maltaromaticum TaxID=2751 RepID=UPI003C22D07C
MSKLLIDDYPIQVLPKLANAIGLNEAIVLQQIHYWINKKTHFKDERYWTYGSMSKWQKENFSWWSLITVKRAFKNLEDMGLLITANYNKAGFDKTKWYSVDYEVLEGMSQRWYQNEPTVVSKRANPKYQNELTNTLDFTETSTETIKDICSNEFERLWSMYPKKQGNKGTALKNYVKARSGKNAVTYEFVEEALKKAISYWKTSQTETKFIPMAATWFNQNRWNDELISESSNASVANRPELNDWEQTRKEMGL